MTKEEFKKILKSRNYKSKHRSGQTHILRFTEVHLIKDDMHLCDYNITKRYDDFLMTFDNFQKNVSSDDFKNVLLISDNIQQAVNIDTKTFKGEYDLVLEGQ
jgi:hypothetical protein